MSDVEGKWGSCASYGCPLAGSMGSEGRWYCFCHVNKPSTDNDRITAILRDMEWLCQSTLEVRGARGSKHWPSIYRNIQQRLIRADRSDLLMCEKDESPYKPGYRNLTIWLMRLERELIDATNTEKRHTSEPKPVAVAGPTHALEHYSEISRPE